MISHRFGPDSVDDPSSDEISLMKMELQTLIQEKGRLKAKIDRLSNFSNHPGERHSRSSALISNELQQTESYIIQRREEINSLTSSDLANLVRERQREARILYQETKRQENLKFQKASEFRDLARKYDQMARKYSPAALDQASAELETLEKELELQERRVDRAQARLWKREEELGTTASRLSDRGRTAVYERIRHLKNRIRQEEAEISLINGEIARRTQENE